MEKTLLIQDVSSDFHLDGAIEFNAKLNAAKCVGCFHCWLKCPGECRFKDGKEQLGFLLATSEKVYIYSKILYGGFSVEIKKLLDRCIPGILPFFKNRNKRQHHAPRYENMPKINVVFYDAKDVSEEEKILAKNIACAMAINMNASECNVQFLDDIPNKVEE